MLAFIAGFIDTAGFVTLFGLFTAHVTGNIVIAAADMVHRGGAGAGTALSMIPVFVVAVALSTLLLDVVRARWPQRALGIMIGIETLLLGCFFVAALCFDPRGSSPDGLPVVVVGSIGVLAMGLQNALAREVPVISYIPTTMITGNLTQMTIAAMRWLRAGRHDAHAPRGDAVEQLKLLAPTFLAFVFGAAVAAAGVATVGYWSFAVPVVVAGGATALSLVPDTVPAW